MSTSDEGGLHAKGPGDTPPLPQHKRLKRAPKPSADLPELVFAGKPVSEGIAIGPVFDSREPVTDIPRRSIEAGQVAAEEARLTEAVERSRHQIGKLRNRLNVLPEDSQSEIAPLLDAYAQMLGPSRLLRGARFRIAQLHVSAETAVLDEAEALGAAFLATASPDVSGEERANIQRRADEVGEIARRIVRNLTHQPFRSFKGLPQGAILVAENLRPADAALLDPAQLAAVATEEGGTDGHTAVMLRALGIPAVLGVAGIAAAVTPGQTAVVDGSGGTIVLNPSAIRLAAARRSVAAFARARQKLARFRHLPAVTTDGHEIELQANLELPIELPLVAQAGAHGIGLLRTEFLFMNRETVPDEDTQTETYRSVIEAMNGDPVSIRVLDWGGEKEIEALTSAGVVPSEAETNPALGMRGIRMLLARPELLETQFSAILRASAAGPTRIMLPMITNVEEVREARAIYATVVRRLRRKGEKLREPLPPLGIMIETPGAALSADALALECDFFALGTNDLTMYTVAVDRGGTDVAHLYDPLHPAVLRLVQFSTEAALRLRMPVSVCGEMAANPKFTPLLLGLGLRSFSMNSAAVPRVKQATRAVRSMSSI